MSIVITTPHSFCVHGINERHCDLNAENAAVSLLRILRTSKYSTVYLPADQPRFQVDLNRPESRDTRFRQSLGKILNNNPALLLDIHSFPYDTFERDYDVVIIDNPPTTEYSVSLKDRLLNHNINVGYITGNSDNDIVIEARSKNVFAMLIEYSEILNISDLNIINGVIADWITD